MGESGTCPFQSDRYAAGVVEQPVSDRVLTIPNIISFIRLAAVPVFWWLVLGNDEVGWATVLLIVVSWTDWIDGYLARRLNQVTKLGKALDPVADRLMIASALVVGLIAGIVPGAIGYPLIAREIYMAVVTFVLVTRRRRTLEVRYIGKLATFLVYGAVQSFYLTAIPFLEVVFEPLAWASAVIGLVLYWYVAFQYTVDARKSLSAVESSSELEEG